MYSADTACCCSQLYIHTRQLQFAACCNVAPYYTRKFISLALNFPTKHNLNIYVYLISFLLTVVSEGHGKMEAEDGSKSEKKVRELNTSF